MRISRIKRKMTRDFITNLSYLSINFIFFVYPLAVIHCHLVVGQSSIGFLTASTFIITLKWNNIMAKKKGWRGAGGKASTVSIGQQANKIQLANRDVWQNWFQRPLPGYAFPLTSSPSRMRNVSLLQDRV